MRTKENAQDYRYFPEPDLLGIEISSDTLKSIRQSIPELPVAKTLRYMKEYGLPETDAVLIAEDTERAELFDSCVSKYGSSPKSICNLILSDIAKYQNDTGCSIKSTGLSPRRLSRVAELIEEGTVSSTAGKRVLSVMLDKGGEPDEIVDSLGVIQNSDETFIGNLVDEVVASNEKSVNDYRNGKKNAAGFIIGQCMKRSAGTANPVMVREFVMKALEN